MPIKKTKTKTVKPTPKKTTPLKVKYYEGIGRRKSSIARARIFLTQENTSNIIINNKQLKDYLPVATLQRIVEEPLNKLKLKDKFNVSIKITGGGISGQAYASSLGIARALIKYDSNLKSILKLHQLTTRDSRQKERKHIGKHGARRGQQWSKR
ncbi:MAG: 30S ribosomal protein S9 [Patescibacteria group bacterium]